MSFTYEYPRPAVTVDVALFRVGSRGEPRVLLIRRKRAPHRGRWALPGGFVDADEDLDVAARREVAEETGLAIGPMIQLGAYGTPGRDPRGHTVSVVFVALATSAAEGDAGDDASACEWHAARRPPALAFDHGVVLRDARRHLAVLAESRERFARTLFRSRQRNLAEPMRRMFRSKP